MIITLCTLVMVFVGCAGQWVQPMIPQLPRRTMSFAIGVYEDRIIMIGGSIEKGNVFNWYSRQLFQYDITHNVFIDNGTLVLPQDIPANPVGTYYAQNENILYIVESTAIHTYNLRSNKFIANVANSLIPSLVYSCVASNGEYLFITGGSYPHDPLSPLNQVQMMDISTKAWSRTSNMNNKRLGHSCVTDPVTNALYVIGGGDDYWAWFSTSVERIQINNITQQSWMNYGDLSATIAFSKAVYYNRKIFVVGGTTQGMAHYSNIMHIINTIDGTISTQSFPYPRDDASVIIVNNTLYVFGGYNLGCLDTWAYYNLSRPILTTVQPISKPTLRPTTTLEPTQNRIVRPTTTLEPTLSTFNTSFNQSSSTQNASFNPTSSSITIYYIILGSIVLLLLLVICAMSIFYAKYKRRSDELTMCIENEYNYINMSPKGCESKDVWV